VPRPFLLSAKGLVPRLNQARRLERFGGFGRTAHTQAKVRGEEADADLSPLLLKKK